MTAVALIDFVNLLLGATKCQN